MERRKFLALGGASLALLSSATLGNPLKPNKSNPKFIWLVLRGALDSLHTLVPTFETELERHRPKLFGSIKEDLLPISDSFALHPALKNLHQWYGQKELLPVVAVSTGYDGRSHFDGQDFMESGLGKIEHDSGWIARALESKGKSGIAISRSIPIAMRGSDRTTNWFPSRMEGSGEEIYQSILNLYQYEPALANNFEKGLSMKAAAAGQMGSSRPGAFPELAEACAKLMLADNTLDCALLELDGWDTHNRQAPRLNTKLAELDQGLSALKQALGPEWDNTVIAVSTEFGRTIRENGTAGTDHGTGSAMFLAGGAVDGGRILGQWPGLKPKQLFENRDLQPTSNVYDWLADALQQHWQLNRTQTAAIFPTGKARGEQLIRDRATA
ncbi:DUF1501 domain-containing protein [Microbulbifer agarilyticus]|uniref:DUF1501 domain-containing protein n=1 Tax=Microbulbifer agarilyticus TaxID=260552 RepID=UPI001CD55B2C|nr:DUF1501 domain-containing protein [Microbulbifer agarilyticus]MCA0892139.1 DUF1501 domain-containing protein [Microbulbifer agarilyticus]